MSKTMKTLLGTLLCLCLMLGVMLCMGVSASAEEVPEVYYGTADNLTGSGTLTVRSARASSMTREERIFSASSALSPEISSSEYSIKAPPLESLITKPHSERLPSPILELRLSTLMREEVTWLPRMLT